MIDQGKEGLCKYTYTCTIYIYLHIHTYICIYIYTFIHLFRCLHKTLMMDVSSGIESRLLGVEVNCRQTSLMEKKPAGLHHSLSKSFRNFEVGEFCESSLCQAMFVEETSTKIRAVRTSTSSKF